MPKIIHSINLEDFRSFDQEFVKFEDVTCLIGANESGKTNLLEAINLAKVGNPTKQDDKQILRISDIRKNSNRHRKSQLPKIEFEVSTHIITNDLVKKLLIENNIRTLKLIRDGNDVYVEIPDFNHKLKLLKNTSPTSISLDDSVSITGITEAEVGKKDIIDAKEANKLTIATNNYICLSNTDEEQYKLSIEKAISTHLAILLEDKDALKEIIETTLLDINNNLRILFWSYESKYSLPDMVEIKDIKTKINELPVIKALFKLGGYSEADIPALLEGHTDTDYQNFFNTLSQNVSRQIKLKWRTNKKLKINITHKTDHLTITIDEPGYSIEPKFRSEGLRWFLAFIIGILSQTDILINNVILIDEPALHLHPGGQKDVLDEINRLAIDNQIIYSTHSHFLIDRRYKERVRFLIKKETKGYALTDVKEPTKEDIFRDPLLRAALVYSISDISFLNENNILVEGNFDKNVIDVISKWLITNNKRQTEIPTLDPNDTSIINCNGASEILKHAKLYKENGLICLSIYDSDNESNTAYAANNLQKIPEKIKLMELTGQKDTTMEDIIPETVFNNALKNWEIKDKLFTGIKTPRMKTILSVLNTYLTGKGFHGDEYSNERINLKHKLEDEIIAELTLFLEKNDIKNTELTKILDLNSIVNKKLIALVKK